MSQLRKIGRIAPTTKNAERLLEITKAELQEGGISDRETWDIADPENRDLIERQRQALLRHPGRYMGAIAGRQALGGTIEGFVKVNTWRVADQLPYETDERRRQRLHEAMESGAHEFASRPLGIFALSAAVDQSSHDRLFVVRTLLRETLEKTRGREVRIGVHKSDPARELIEQYFEPTGKQGAPIPAIDDYIQELYVRPSSD